MEETTREDRGSRRGPRPADRVPRTGRAPAWIAALAAAAFACERPSDTPPPEPAAAALARAKQGFNEKDVDLLCGDFAEIMFTKGFTRERYLEIAGRLKGKHGEWISEVYLGQKNDGAHEWRARFAEGDAKVVLYLDRTGRVTGLWFR